MMTAYLGWKRETEVAVDPLDLGAGAGRVSCFECEGTGDWSRFLPDRPPNPEQCVSCKGTGFVLISI